MGEVVDNGAAADYDYVDAGNFEDFDDYEKETNDNGEDADFDVEAEYDEDPEVG